MGGENFLRIARAVKLLYAKCMGHQSGTQLFCMAQRIEAIRASLLDTSTQDAPTGQYSCTQHSLAQHEDSGGYNDNI